jgi:replicative DNA helicase
MQPKTKKPTNVEALGKVQPQATELEEAILGAVMLEQGATDLMLSVLPSREVFYNPQHQIIFDAIQSLHTSSKPIDILTVKTELAKQGKLETAGGAYYLAELTSKVNSSANLEYHCRVVLELSVKRELIKESSKITSRAYEDSVDVLDLLDEQNAGMSKIQQLLFRKQALRSNDIAMRFHERLVEKMKNNAPNGVPTPLLELNNLIGGWQKKNLIIVAARPAMGKTAFMLACLKAAAREGVECFVPSLEMGREELFMRLLADEMDYLGVWAPMDKLKNPKNMNEHDFRCYEEALQRVSALPFTIDDTPSQTVGEIKAKAHLERRKTKAEFLVLVDYLQLIRGDYATQLREQEISYISKSLKALAKELDCPVIALSQLSRAVEQRADKRPQLSDLRESGSIEQDADMVGFLYRPEYYGITSDAEGVAYSKGYSELIIAKQRNGTLADIPFLFDGSSQSIKDW